MNHNKKSMNGDPGAIHLGFRNARGPNAKCFGRIYRCAGTAVARAEYVSW